MSMKLLEKANRYYHELAPHVKDRQGSKIMKELIDELEAEDKQLTEYAEVISDHGGIHLTATEIEECPTYYDGCNCAGPEVLKKICEQRTKAIQAMEECHDALVELRDTVKTHKDFQGRDFIGLGIKVNSAINRAVSSGFLPKGVVK